MTHLPLASSPASRLIVACKLTPSWIVAPAVITALAPTVGARRPRHVSGPVTTLHRGVCAVDSASSSDVLLPVRTLVALTACTSLARRLHMAHGLTVCRGRHQVFVAMSFKARV